MAPTYTLEIMFHDLHDLPTSRSSSNLYLAVELRVPGCPPLAFRTPTIRRSKDSQWCPSLDGEHVLHCAQMRKETDEQVCVSNGRWIVGGVPSSGFQLYILVMDEGRAHHNTPVGTARIPITRLQHLGVGFAQNGMQIPVKLRKIHRTLSWENIVTALWSSTSKSLQGSVTLSIRVVAPTGPTESYKLHTVGPSCWTQHFSPLLGALARARYARSAEPLIDDVRDTVAAPFDPRSASASSHRRIRASTFVANTLQFPGPVPRDLDIGFVGYTPWMAWMFDQVGTRGAILNRLLHKQHRHVYSHDRHTRYGIILPFASPLSHGGDISPKASCSSEGDSEIAHGQTLARQFLRMCAFGAGGRVFTYALTLDGMLRWSETGEHLSDFLSKHAMHANAAIRVAFAGEFYITLLDPDDVHHQRKLAQLDDAMAIPQGSNDTTNSPQMSDSSYPPDSDKLENPKLYEIVIDNASGTYRPPSSLLPILHSFLSAPHRLGSLGRITAVDVSDPALLAHKTERAAERLSTQRRLWKAGRRKRPQHDNSG